MWSRGFSHLQSWNAVSLILLMFSLLIFFLIYGYSFYKCIFCNGIGQKKISSNWNVWDHKTTPPPPTPPPPPQSRQEKGGRGGGGMGIAQKLALALVWITKLHLSKLSFVISSSWSSDLQIFFLLWEDCYKGPITRACRCPTDT